MSTVAPSANLNDYEKLLRVISHYMMSELEEIAPFDSKTDTEREELIKVALKSIETSTIVLHEFLKPDAINFQKLEKANDLINEKKYQDAYEFIFTSTK